MHNSQARGEDLDKTEKKGVKTHSCIQEAFGELDEQAGHGVGGQGREQDPVNPADGIRGEELEGVQGVQVVVQHEPSA